MKKIFIPSQSDNIISIDKIKKRDVIYVKHDAIPKGFVCITDSDLFYIRYFNDDISVKYSSLEKLIKYHSYLTFYYIDN